MHAPVYGRVAKSGGTYAAVFDAAPGEFIVSGGEAYLPGSDRRIHGSEWAIDETFRYVVCDRDFMILRAADGEPVETLTRDIFGITGQDLDRYLICVNAYHRRAGTPTHYGLKTNRERNLWCAVSGQPIPVNMPCVNTPAFGRIALGVALRCLIPNEAQPAQRSNWLGSMIASCPRLPMLGNVAARDRDAVVFNNRPLPPGLFDHSPEKVAQKGVVASPQLDTSQARTA